MVEVTRERQGQIVQEAFRVLAEKPEGLPAREVIAEVVARVRLTPYEADDYPNSSVRRFDKILRFSTIAAVKAGWLVKSKGRWTLTEDGRHALAAIPEPGAFYRESIRLYRVWKRSQPDTDAADVIDDLDEDTTSALTTLEEAEETAWSEIAEYLAAMPWQDFQSLVAALLRAMDYHVAWVAPPGRDHGIDVLAFTDPLGATGPRIKVQVKRQNSAKIDVGEIRAFMAVLTSTQDVGIYVASGGFTSEAQREARNQETRRLTLIDLERLFDLWVERYGKVAEDDRSLLPLKPVYYLAPQE
jgi:restriction system protein